MPKALEFIANHLSRVTEKDVRRFSASVEIKDAMAFAADLQAFNRTCAGGGRDHQFDRRCGRGGVQRIERTLSRLI